MINFITANYSFPLLSSLFSSFPGTYASLPSLYLLDLPVFYLSYRGHLYQHPFIQSFRINSSLLFLLFLILNFLILLSPPSSLFSLPTLFSSFFLSSFFSTHSFRVYSSLLFLLFLIFFIFSRCFLSLFYLFFPRCSSLFLFYPVNLFF